MEEQAEHGRGLSGLAALDAFMRAAESLDGLAALCELAAQTIARLEGAVVMVGARDCVDLDGSFAMVCAGEGLGLDLCVAEPSLRPHDDAPATILAALERERQAVHEGLEPGALGLEPGPALKRVAASTVVGDEGLAVWVGVCAGPDAPAQPEARALTRLVARHLLSAVKRARERRLHHEFEIKYRTIIEQLPAVVYYRALDKPGEATFMSPQVEDILGYTPEEFTNNRALFVECLHPEDRDALLAKQAAEQEQGGMLAFSVEYRMIHRDGRTVWVHNRGLTACDRAGNPTFMIGILFDNTQTKQLEQQYLHAQKMDAVGRLASGIAHDFNNILMVILAHAEFIGEELEPGSQSIEDLGAIVDASEQARLLVTQLLSFARRQTQSMRPLELGEVLDRMRTMVGRVLRHDIALEFDEQPELGRVLADRGQLEQIIMNLLVNARDAMPEGGTLRVEARNLTLHESLAEACEPVAPGDYVMFSVSDSGVGMDPHTREHLFEPFFTTKTQGTGLGMATVLGLVRQHGGTLSVASELGEGTTITVYLPRHRS